ncbi:hypothetical protein AOLI_G00320940 [Acnodon oligacanthus]
MKHAELRLSRSLTAGLFSSSAGRVQLNALRLINADHFKRGRERLRRSVHGRSARSNPECRPQPRGREKRCCAASPPSGHSSGLTQHGHGHAETANRFPLRAPRVTPDGCPAADVKALKWTELSLCARLWIRAGEPGGPAAAGGLLKREQSSAAQIFTASCRAALRSPRRIPALGPRQLPPEPRRGGERRGESPRRCPRSSVQTRLFLPDLFLTKINKIARLFPGKSPKKRSAQRPARFLRSREGGPREQLQLHICSLHVTLKKNTNNIWEK